MQPVVVNLNSHARPSNNSPSQMRFGMNQLSRNLPSNRLVVHMDDENSLPIIEDTSPIFYPSAPPMVNTIQTGAHLHPNNPMGQPYPPSAPHMVIIT